jgi:hypothetical protein
MRLIQYRQVSCIVDEADITRFMQLRRLLYQLHVFDEADTYQFNAVEEALGPISCS